MSNLIQDKTLYQGISDYIPYDIDSFTQENINKVIKINNKLPDINEVIKVSIASSIRDEKIVKTAIGTSLEGQKLTGYKLLTEGEFSVRIDFCTDTSSGCMYTYKDIMFFNNATTLDEDSNKNSKLLTSVYIEDIYAKKLNNREILINISFIFTAEKY